MFQPHEAKEVKYLNELSANWILQGENGDLISLHDLSGKVVFINFWATWCPPCIAELPDIQKLYSKYGNAVYFLLITNEDKAVIDNFIQTKKYNLPIYYHVSGQIPDELFSKSIPATFVVSKSGRIVIDKRGAAKWNGDKIHQIIEGLLNE